jgi:MATE family multidrug resistance protein
MLQMINFFKNGNFRQVLKIAFPLMLSSAAHALNLFIDRAMLAGYSDMTLAAAFPAGLSAFAFSCLFLGTVGYSGAFVAQYHGAGEPGRIGCAVWQGIWIALIGGLAMVGLSFFAEEIFDLFGHEAEVRTLEVAYFRILASGTVANLLFVALSNFWSGRGKVRMVMTVNLLLTSLNVLLNYLLIYGKTISLPFGLVLNFPEMGIRGAACGTVLASLFGAAVFGIGFFCFAGWKKYGVGKCFDLDLFWRLIRYGAPTGIQLAIDLIAFQIFIVLQGKVDSVALAASGIAFGINSLAFTPLLGIGQTAGILVGQSVGAGDIPHGERSVRSAALLGIGYVSILGFMFFFWPDPFLMAFKNVSGPIMTDSRLMLRFVAGYLFFDALFIIYSNAIKSAGDTRFSMVTHALLAIFTYAIPCLALFAAYRQSWFLELFGSASRGWCLWGVWTISVIYVMLCGVIFYMRYRQGKWKQMRVIDTPQGAK